MAEPAEDRARRPLFARIKDAILEDIAHGRYRPGDRLPSEAGIVAAFGVSRMTANRALRELMAAGAILRRPGVGSFVAEPRAHGELLAIRDIADELAGSGHVHRPELLERRRLLADAALAKAFGVAPGTPLVQVRIRHRRDGVPVLIEDRFVDETIAPGFFEADLGRESCHRVLMRLAPLEEAEHCIRAIAATPEMRRLLSLAPGEPCLLLHRRTRSRGRVASVADLTHAGSRYELAGRFEG